MTRDDVVAVLAYPSRKMALYALSLVNLKDSESNTLILRHMRGMTQEETAEALGVSKNTVQNWERKSLRKCAAAWDGLDVIADMISKR